MRQILFILIMVMVPSLIMAQTSGGQVKRPVKKQQAETVPFKKKATMNSSSLSTKPKTLVGELHMYEDEKTNKFGYLDDAGNVIVQAKYNYSYGTQSYFAQTEFCFLNNERPEIGVFYDGMAMVADSCGYGFVDKNGNEIIKCQYHIVLPFREGLAAVEDKKTMKWGYINKKGEVVIPFIFVYPRSFTEGYAFVKKEDNKWAYIDKRGENITPWGETHRVNLFFVDGLAPIYSNGKCGYIDYSGKIAIPCIYDDAEQFSGKYAAVKKGEKWGVINRDGQYVIPPIYSLIFNIVDSYVFAQDENRNKGVVDVLGNSIIPFEYSSLSYAGDSIFIISIWDRSTEKWKRGFKHASGKLIYGIELEGAYGYNMGLASVKKNGKWGFIDKKGNLVIPFKYDDSRDFEEDGMAFVKLDNLWVSIDTKGNVQTPYGDPNQAHRYRAEARKKLKSGIK